jgi:hypothetical protein
MIMLTIRFSVIFFFFFLVYADGALALEPPKFFDPSPFVPVQEFGVLNVDIYSEIPGLDQAELTDLLRLRFRNTFNSVPFKETNLFRAQLDDEIAKKIGRINVRVYTVGTSYPVAYNISIEAGSMACSRSDYENAILGYASSDAITRIVREAISTLVDDAAVAFFKARGSL